MSEDNKDNTNIEEKTPFDVGVETFANCNIPFNTKVWCPTAQRLLPVGDRANPVGLCNIIWHYSGFYVTMDEKTAIEQHITNAAWSWGFMISKTLSQVYEHFGIKKQLLIRNEGGDFIYWRNFPILEYETKHPTLSHIHHTEYDLILEIETGEDKESEKDGDALNNSFSSETSTSKTMSQAVHHSVTSGVKIQFLDKLNRTAIQQHKNWKLTDTNNKYSLEQVTVHSAPQISELFAGREHIPSSSDRSWRNWTFEKFYEKLLSCFAESTQTNILTKLLTAISLDPDTYSLDVLANGDTSISGYLTLSTALENLLDMHGALCPDKAINADILTPANNQNLANFLFRLIRVDDSSTANQSTPRLHFKQRLLALNKKRNNREDFESIEQFKDCLVRTYNERSNVQCDAGGFGLIPSAFPPAVSASFMLDEANYMQVHGSSSSGIHPHVSQPKSGKQGNYKGNTPGPRNQNLNNLTQGKVSAPCNAWLWMDRYLLFSNPVPIQNTSWI